MNCYFNAYSFINIDYLCPRPPAFDREDLDVPPLALWLCDGRLTLGDELLRWLACCTRGAEDRWCLGALRCGLGALRCVRLTLGVAFCVLLLEWERCWTEGAVRCSLFEVAGCLLLLGELLPTARPLVLPLERFTLSLFTSLRLDVDLAVVELERPLVFPPCIRLFCVPVRLVREVLFFSREIRVFGAVERSLREVLLFRDIPLLVRLLALPLTLALELLFLSGLYMDTERLSALERPGRFVLRRFLTLTFLPKCRSTSRRDGPP